MNLIDFAFSAVLLKHRVTGEMTKTDAGALFASPARYNNLELGASAKLYEVYEFSRNSEVPVSEVLLSVDEIHYELQRRGLQEPVDPKYFKTFMKVYGKQLTLTGDTAAFILAMEAADRT